MEAAEKPIGFWLKLVDGLIERSFDVLLAGAGLSRRHWQVLNLLRSAPADRPGLGDALRPFWTEASPGIDEVLQELRQRDWIETSSQAVHSLTSEGCAAHRRIEELVNANRRRLADGISPDEYRAAIAVLRRMAGNLERVA